ncbi:MAG: hypothetical protein AMXMBFR58_06450 [Phycisphaerae bacterium]
MLGWPAGVERAAACDSPGVPQGKLVTSRRKERKDAESNAPGGHRVVGPLLVVISAISFGFMPLFSHWCDKGGVALEMKLGLRFLLGAALLTGLALRERSTWPTGRRLVALAAVGGGLYLAEAYSYFGALALGTPSGLVSLLLYLYPVSVTVGAWLVMRERVSPGKWAVLGIAMVGLALTLGPVAISGWGSASVIPGGVAGILLGLLSGVVYAIYILVASRLVTRQTAMTATAIVCWSAAAAYLSIAAVRGQALPSTVMGVTGVAMLGTVSTAVAMTCFLAGSAWIGPVRAATLSILEPVTTVAIGVLVLGERAGWVQAVGGALILIGAMLAARRR